MTQLPDDGGCGKQGARTKENLSLEDVSMRTAALVSILIDPDWFQPDTSLTPAMFTHYCSLQVQTVLSVQTVVLLWMATTQILGKENGNVQTAADLIDGEPSATHVIV